MLPIPDAFDHEYGDTTISFGRGRVDDLAATLDDHGLERVLLVCGANTGANDALMDPIRAGLGDRPVAVFDGSTPDKRLDSVYAGIDRMNEVDPDVVIGIGGGSAINIARQMTVFAADGRPIDHFVEAAHEETIEPPRADDPLPTVVVPTTLCGADISGGGSIEVLAPGDSPTGFPIRTNGTNWPIAIVHDPDLFETTPFGALAGSTMNGFNKGLETCYGADSTGVAHATAIHGLALMRQGVPHLADGGAAMDRAVLGHILVQLDRRVSIMHAFGHGFSRNYTVQQGVTHAVMAPIILEYLFDTIDANRALLARGLGVDPEPDPIVEAVTTVRDSLDLPTRLREVDPIDRADFPALAEFIIDDPPMARAPADLEPTTADFESVLEAAW